MPGYAQRGNSTQGNALWVLQAGLWGGGGLEAPKPPKKNFGLNQLAPKAPEKICDWPEAR